MSSRGSEPAARLDPEFDPVRDRLILADTVRTMDPARPRAQAVAVRGGRIAAVGSVDEARAAVAADAEVVELQGATLLPGFHDAHVHLAMHGVELAQVRLEDAATVDEALERLRLRAGELPAGRWVEGTGFTLQRWNLPRPDRAALDAVVPDHPVLLRSQDHHSGWANSRALDAAGVHAGTPEPEGGMLPRREDGSPTGHLLETAVDLVARAVPERSDAELDDALEQAGHDLASLGVTTVHTMAYEPPTWWRAVARNASREDYPLRVWACIPHRRIESAASLGLATGQGGGRFTIGGAKFFVDGALGSLTSWMLEPYDGSDDAGVRLDGPEVLRERIPAAIRAGLTPVAHAIGDAAVRALLHVYESTADAWRAAGLRPRIEHAQHVHPDDVVRIGALELVASMQPLHLAFDAATVHRRLAGREDRAYPVRSLAAAGAVLAFGSDTPVAPPNVIETLRTAVRRGPADGPSVARSEALTPEEALAAYTLGGARAIRREGSSGVLRRGADADLVALSRDPVDDPFADDLAVVATLSAGRFTYR